MATGFSSPACFTDSSIVSPGRPRIRLTESGRDIPTVGTPEISQMVSPARIPARKAGVWISGLNTIKGESSSFYAISIPMPPNS
jgi:hypothetical protein